LKQRLLVAHYSGVAKILKVYTYQLAVDTWGTIHSDTQKLAANVNLSMILMKVFMRI
jgi:hypothetical protein